MSAAAAVAAALNNFPPAMHAGHTNGQLHVTSGGSTIKLEGGGGSIASLAGCGSVSSVTSSGNAAYYNTFAAASPEPNNHALLTATGGSYSTFYLALNNNIIYYHSLSPEGEHPRVVTACRPFAVAFQVQVHSTFP